MIQHENELSTLHLQSMVWPGMNLLDSFDRAVTRMRDGWARTYTPPVWDLELH